MSAEPAAGGTSGGDLLLDFEAWVALSARLLDLDAEQRQVILDERGLDADDWARCDEHHALELADEVAAGRLARADRYGLACAEELARRREAPPAPAPAPPPPVEKEEEPIAPAPVSAPVVEVPSYQAASFQKEAEAPAPPSTPIIEVPSFHKGPPASSPAPSLNATVDIVPDFSAILKRANALPFSGNAALALAASQGAPPSKPPPSKPPGALGETQAFGVDMVALARGVLPFAGQGAAPSFPQLPLQSYASLCAELSVYPDRATQILERYGIRDEPSRRALDEDWRVRLAGSPEMREECRRLSAVYEEWLRRKPT